MELRLPLEMSPGREAACRAVFGTWGFFPNDARKNCPFVLTSFTGWSSERCPGIGFFSRGHREIGNGSYAGLGVGTYYYDGDFYGDVWYALRAGFKVPIISNGLVLDVNVNYRVENWDDIKDAGDKVDKDTLMIGAALRLGF